MIIPKDININFGIPAKEDLRELRKDNEYLKSIGVEDKLILVVNCLVCNEVVKSRGLNAHYKRKHPEEFWEIIDDWEKRVRGELK